MMQATGMTTLVFTGPLARGRLRGTYNKNDKSDNSSDDKTITNDTHIVVL